MKFKRENNELIIVVIIFMIVFLIFDVLMILQETKDTNEVGAIITLSLICPVMLLVVINHIRGTKYDKLYDKFKDGKKIEGYIVSTFQYRYRYGRNYYKTSYGMKVLANSQIYIVDRLENDEVYNKLEKIISDFRVNHDKITFNKLPVDVYLKNDDYYVDIKNIKL